MKSKALVHLFLINFSLFFIGMGLIPLLPLYATQFGASATATGLIMASTAGAITLGTLAAGRLARKYGHRKLFLLAGIPNVPALILLGHVSTFWQMIPLTSIVWFTAGIGTAMVNVYAGLRAKKEKRGKAFGILFIALPAAALASGLTVGNLVDNYGYPVMFSVLAGVSALWPILVLAGPKDYYPRRYPIGNRSTSAAWRDLGKYFYLLLVVTMLSAMTIYLTRLGVSLSLQSLNFTASAIVSTAAVGGLLAIPSTYVLGTLSDRMDRRYLLLVGYGLAASGALILEIASELWHFWLATGLLFVARSTNGSIAPAWATDILADDMIGRGLPYLNAATWLAGIAGSLIAGKTIDSMGMTSLYLLAAGLAISAALLLGLSYIHRWSLTEVSLNTSTNS